MAAASSVLITAAAGAAEAMVASAAVTGPGPSLTRRRLTLAAASSVLAAAGGGTAEAIERIVEARESPTTPCFFAVASPKPSKQSNALSRPELHPPLLASSCRKATPLPFERGKLRWQLPHLHSSRPKLVVQLRGRRGAKRTPKSRSNAHRRTSTSHRTAGKNRDDPVR